MLAFVQLTIERHNDVDTEAFRTAVRAHPEVVACWVTTGTHDFLLQVMAPDMDAFADFVMNRVLRFPGVKDVNSSFVLQTVKPPSVLPLTHLKMVDAAARTG